MRTPEYLITIPTTGLRIIPPEETRRNIAFARSGILPFVDNTVYWSDREKARLKLLATNPIMRKRFPTRESGRKYMDAIDYERRESLLGYAYELSDHIASSWQEINKSKPISVILFGSVATGLVKNCNAACPSNIDLAVIGDFSEYERTSLYDAIRGKRTEIQERILADCVEINSQEANPGNAGVTIQNVSKIIKSNFGGAREYIAAGAIALHDPYFIWDNIEQCALESYIQQKGVVFSSQPQQAKR
jgi:predicted nucleotidyltransferase